VSSAERTPAAPARGALTPAQRRNQERVETLIGIAAPFLDLLLAVGDRVSRIAEPQDYEYYPVRAGELPGDQRRDAASGD
jgi:hypothetical protein